MKRMLIGMLLALTLIATPVMAKEGFFVGAYLMPSEDTSGDALSGLNSGSGYGFKAGLGFNKYISINGIIEKSSFDASGGGTVKMDGAAIDLHINFPLTTLDSAKVMSFEPYLLFGYALKYEAKAGGQTRSGNGPRYGFGIEQYLFRELSINGGWTRTSISFDNPSQDGTIRAFDIGLTYHFL
jgi:hypothetical protein